MSPFEITLRTVTPAFCRGQDAATPELRAPSLKGQLRWWYRAWHPLAVIGLLDEPWAEGRVMGGTHAHAGQSPFLLRVEQERLPREISWQEIEQAAPRGSRTQVAGIRYLGFAFRRTRENPKEHWAVAQDTTFKAVHVFPRRDAVTPELARGLVAAWWLLAHLGGLGARARRGFGSLALDSWTWPGQEALLAELPLPLRAAGARAWEAAMLQGLRALEDWRRPGTWPQMYPHPRLGPGAEVVLQADPDWRRAEDALEAAGLTLATERREHRGREPVDGRVTVGLPLTSGRPARSWEPGSWRTERFEKTDRHASPIHIHVAAFRGGFGLVWSRLAGPVPGRGLYRVREAGSRDTVRVEAPDTVGALMQSLQGTRWTAEGRS